MENHSGEIRMKSGETVAEICLQDRRQGPEIEWWPWREREMDIFGDLLE